jgi:hypothetical protein
MQRGNDCPCGGVVDDRRMRHTLWIMSARHGQVWLAVVLIVIGVAFLLDALGALGSQGPPIGSVFMALGGAAFVAVFIRSRRNWWAVIPGFALLSLAGISLLGESASTIGGAIVLGAIGMSFLIIFLSSRDRWWAILPGGALITLGILTVSPDAEKGWILFLGLAVTFLLVAVVPRSGRQTWAWIPAGILAGLSGLAWVGIERHLQLIWPATLIVAGALLLVTRRSPRGG